MNIDFYTEPSDLQKFGPGAFCFSIFFFFHRHLLAIASEFLEL